MLRGLLPSAAIEMHVHKLTRLKSWSLNTFKVCLSCPKILRSPLLPVTALFELNSKMPRTQAYGKAENRSNFAASNRPAWKRRLTTKTLYRTRTKRREERNFDIDSYIAGAPDIFCDSDTWDRMRHAP